MIIWDLATGAIVTTLTQQPKPTLVVNFGGWTRDVKRRDTGLYQFVTAGLGGVMLWSLNPLDGSTKVDNVSAAPVLLAPLAQGACCGFADDDRNVKGSAVCTLFSRQGVDLCRFAVRGDRLH